MQNTRAKSIAIIGGGPAGLAAAAHAIERDLQPVVLELGPAAGHAVRQWGHVRMFSPWAYNVDKACARLLAATAWNAPDPDAYPTGAELADLYLEPLATRTALAASIRTSAEVVGISRIGFDKVKTRGREAAPFEIRYRSGSRVEHLTADAVIDASGTWFSPNPAGANGLPAIGEAEMSAQIAYGMPDVLGRDRNRYAGKTTAVLGSGHSSIGTLLDLAQLKQEAPVTELVWIIRGDDPSKTFGGGANDQLAARGALGSSFARLISEGHIRVETGFRLSDLSGQGNRLRIGSGSSCCARHLVADELIVATGLRPALALLGELRLALDPALECPTALAPLIDPNEHSCGTVRPHGARELAHPESGFYIAGMKSYGRAPTFLMTTGYEQVRSIVAAIAGDEEAARRVELVLPETGVCSGPSDAEEVGCCGGPATANAAACCAAHEAAKAAGAWGCRYGAGTESQPRTVEACCG
jgi:thioredoxin reductase